VKDGEEQPVNDESKKWTGATELYRIIENETINQLEVEIDVLDEHLDFMNKTLPKAFERIKNISEKLQNDSKK
jgi:hypothetical protein